MYHIIHIIKNGLIALLIIELTATPGFQHELMAALIMQTGMEKCRATHSCTSLSVFWCWKR